MTVLLKKYSAEYLEDCITVLGQAFVTNPLHLCAFGPGRIDQNRLFFRIGLRHMFIGQSFVALHDGEVCGYVHFNPWPDCLPAPYVEHLRQEKAAGYLETDRWENVEFYKKFGFAVQADEELIGTRIWYMWRPASG